MRTDWSSYIAVMIVTNTITIAFMILDYLNRKKKFIRRRSPHLVLTAAIATLVDFDMALLTLDYPDSHTPKIPCLVFDIIRTTVGFIPMFV
jgi:hypothetical protein